MESDSVVIICFTILIVLFAGDPDLMDAIIKAISGLSTECLSNE
jgi:hypothetical protein